MRISLLVLGFFILLASLAALQVPYSLVPIQTVDNHISGLERSDPPDARPCPLATDAWVWHDGHFLCVLVVSAIDSTFVPGVNATKDDFQNSDYIRVQLTTLTDVHYAYFFAVYPRGNTNDAVRDENLSLDNAWNSRLIGESHWAGNTWTTTFKIPFRDLRFEGKPPYNWGINVARRVEKDRSSYTCPFSAAALMTIDEYYQAVVPLVISEQIETPQNYTVAPSYYRSYDLKSKSQSFDPDNVGLTLVYRPTSTSSVKMAFNPDFSDVPVDAERDAHNDKYPPTLAENRLFFTEDVNAFGVGSDLFYTRNIMQPAYAVKYTLNNPHWTVGALNAIDKETSESGVVINPDDTYSILAVRPDYGVWNCQTTILDRRNNGWSNTVYHLLPNWKVTPNFTVRSILSHSVQDDSTITTGDVTSLVLGYRNNGIDWSGHVSKISKDYFPAMGDAFAQTERDYTQLGSGLVYTKVFPRQFMYYMSENLNYRERRENEDFDELRSGLMTLYVETRFRPRLTIGTYGEWLRDRVGDEVMQSKGMSITPTWYQYPWAELSVTGTIGEYLFNSLGKVYPYKDFSVSWSGVYGPYLSYILRNTFIMWSGMPEMPGLDEAYNITNLDAEITFTNYLKLVTGIRHNDYQGYYRQRHIGCFATLRWDYNPSTKLFLGFRNTTNEYSGDYITDAKSAWFKIYREF